MKSYPYFPKDRESIKGMSLGLTNVARQKLKYAANTMFNNDYGDVMRKALKFTRAKFAKAIGYYPYFIPFEENNSTVVTIDGEEKIMLGSNNYLGLTDHPDVIKAGQDAMRKYGTGMTGSRFLNGNLRIHEELEQAIAKFVNKPAALVFSTGFAVNAGVISTICDENCVILSDYHNHASIINGVRLSEAVVHKYDFRQPEKLDRILSTIPSEIPKFLVTDGVFSMEGCITDLPALIKLKEKHRFRIMVDDAHALGVLGQGRGTAHHFGLTEEVDLIMGTFSKSLGGVGGYIAGEEFVIDFLKHNTRPFIFTASLPPAIVASVHKALEIMQLEPDRIDRLWENTRYMQRELKTLGFDTWNSETPIIPVVIGSNIITFNIWRRLFDEGIYTNPVIEPAVPEGYSLLRTSYMATHTKDQLDRVLEVFSKVGKEFDII